jgi:dTDP-4-amino-4,6-dideoxygalactose transaminase
VGSSYLPSEVLGAILYAQLEAREEIQARRTARWHAYLKALSPWAEQQEAALPHIPPHCEHPSHLFYILLATARARDALIEHLKARGILSVFHYLPLHLSPMGQSFGGRPGDCPVTEDVSQRLLRLPLYNDMTDVEQERVVESVLSFAGR